MFNITTTGTLSPVVFNDLGGRSFPHPTTDFNLLTEFSIEEINKSADVQSAITNGHITASDGNGNDITSVVSSTTVVPLKAYQESPAITDASSTITLTYAPLLNSEAVIYNGAIQTEGSSYSISGKIITFSFDLYSAEDVVVVKYLY
jgi:hypothetical protein